MTSFQYIKASPGVLEIGCISPVFQGIRPLGRGGAQSVTDPPPSGETSRRRDCRRQVRFRRPHRLLEISGNLTVFGLQQSPGLGQQLDGAPHGRIEFRVRPDGLIVVDHGR